MRGGTLSPPFLQTKGSDHSLSALYAEAFNTAMQVKKFTLEEYAGKFESLKEAFLKAKLDIAFSDIFFHQNRATPPRSRPTTWRPRRTPRSRRNGLRPGNSASSHSFALAAHTAVARAGSSRSDLSIRASTSGGETRANVAGPPRYAD